MVTKISFYLIIYFILLNNFDMVFLFSRWLYLFHFTFDSLFKMVLPITLVFCLEFFAITK